jgi:hypothetical protein
MLRRSSGLGPKLFRQRIWKSEVKMTCQSMWTIEHVDYLVSLVVSPSA